MRTMALSLAGVFVLGFAAAAGAQPIECRSSAPLVTTGSHIVQVMIAAGSGIDPNNLPQVGSPVLTLEHR